jgi:hypothetical protein
LAPLSSGPATEPRAGPGYLSLVTHQDAVERGLHTPGVATRDRLLAWLVTGPAGRVAAFVLDFGAAALRGAAARLRRR